MSLRKAYLFVAVWEGCEEGEGYIFNLNANYKNILNVLICLNILNLI